MAHPEMVEALAIVDSLEQEVIPIRHAQEPLRDIFEIYREVREETHELFMEIVKKYNDAPVFRIQCPAPHKELPSA